METFTMSRKEVPRVGLVKAVLAGKVTRGGEGGRSQSSSESSRRVPDAMREGRGSR
jgi:hypothetical protein